MVSLVADQTRVVVGLVGLVAADIHIHCHCDHLLASILYDLEKEQLTSILDDLEDYLHHRHQIVHLADRAGILRAVVVRNYLFSRVDQILVDRHILEVGNLVVDRMEVVVVVVGDSHLHIEDLDHMMVAVDNHLDLEGIDCIPRMDLTCCTG